MHSYLVNFTIYTLAMLGVIFIAFMIAKKSLSLGNLPGHKNGSLTIENRLSLEPRKNLYIIRAGEERFLISTDIEGSRFLTKLEQNGIPVYKQEEEDYNLSDNFADNVALTNIKSNSSVMRRMLEKLNSDKI
ncbi:MAG: flagellar biosynthetic protein FliO [Candidatus Gastranaerophilales bacterium]|nr:flagellar biosynthetic protein FliO [Candidatus Gastranaerophilales bacterium]